MRPQERACSFPQAQWYLDDAYTRQTDGRWVYRFFRVGEITHTYYCYDYEGTETFSRANEVMPDSVILVSESWASPMAGQLQWLEQHDYPMLVNFIVHITDEGKK